MRKTSHEQCIIITSNCQRCCHFSLVNLCGEESLCDISEISVIILLANGTLGAAMPIEFAKQKGL